ncbi:HD-GYP domain-containing protein [Paenibacillus radicis (ex Xue et al. 2023)]|uniref:HD-GYP domain-containing protein n=1 Tax=Paenibacillus radicis (ex Xue et al. 2023) TaxID=2972489 RepID=A0ABT1YT54_9BACL|nr:HD-GYP domain-containing protein [Paenibacillus radicis (ex Xue et al. 2023)]MCR8636369.1 HD-GYP domain-containing protein [Paenibacillus radicis (ex Xue et al. 2023)]
MITSNEMFYGKQLKQDKFNHSGILIVPARTLLGLEQLQVLNQHGISLDEHDVNEGTERTDHSALVDESVLIIEEIFQEIRYTKQIPLLTIRKQIFPMIYHTTEQPNLFGLFACLQSKDDYTFRHNIGVGVIATLIGRWLELKENVLSQLTIAATLHDVGKLKIPLEILNKPDKLTTEEFELMKQHAFFGYEMIKNTVGTNQREALVAYQHHERQDGSGYPLGVKGDEISFFSRIVAVADVFHAMTSKRAYRNAAPFYETLKQMHDNAFGVLDPQIIRLFMDKIMQSIIGNEVLLTDGRTGTIVMVNPHDPLHPLVSMSSGFLDLSKQSSCHIERILI